MCQDPVGGRGPTNLVSKCFQSSGGVVVFTLCVLSRSFIKSILNFFWVYGENLKILLLSEKQRKNIHISFSLNTHLSIVSSFQWSAELSVGCEFLFNHLLKFYNFLWSFWHTLVTGLFMLMELLTQMYI